VGDNVIDTRTKILQVWWDKVRWLSWKEIEGFDVTGTAWVYDNLGTVLGAGGDIDSSTQSVFDQGNFTSSLIYTIICTIQQHLRISFT
jgi:hypothetical protein